MCGSCRSRTGSGFDAVAHPIANRLFRVWASKTAVEKARLFRLSRAMMPSPPRGTSMRCPPLRSTAILFCSLLFATPAGAATCGGDFSAFLVAMSREAAAVGISRTVTDNAFAGLTQDGAVLAFDRRQRGTFRKSFEEYAATRVVPARINRARQLMHRHAALLARIERQFGVPATLLMAIWTLESDNGTGDMGKLPVIRTLATLAHDCRRTDLFQGELLAALQILQRGDLSLRDLIGA